MGVVFFLLFTLFTIIIAFFYGAMRKYFLYFLFLSLLLLFFVCVCSPLRYNNCGEDEKCNYIYPVF